MEILKSMRFEPIDILLVIYALIHSLVFWRRLMSGHREVIILPGLLAASATVLIILVESRPAIFLAFLLLVIAIFVPLHHLFFHRNTSVDEPSPNTFERFSWYILIALFVLRMISGL